MEKFPKQPTTNAARPAEDLHSILDRFQNWSGKEPGNHNGHKQNSNGVREIPMEEAMRQLRSRRAQSGRPPAEKARATQPPGMNAAPESEPAVTPGAALVTEAAGPSVQAPEILKSTVKAKPAAKAKPASVAAKPVTEAVAPPAKVPEVLKSLRKRKPAVRMHPATLAPVPTPAAEIVASPERAPEVLKSAIKPKPLAKAKAAAAEPKSSAVAKAVSLSVSAPRRLTSTVKAKPAAKAKSAAATMKEPLVKRLRASQESVKAPRIAASAQRKSTKPAERHRRATKTPSKKTRLAARREETAAARRGKAKPEFREMLARSVREEKQEKQQERRQRVSVRLSRAEERRLQQRANEAGLTISEFLRSRALDAEPQRPEAARTGLEHRTRNGRPATAAPLFAASTGQNGSLLGGWLALLRNRFLASPVRFSEQA